MRRGRMAGVFAAALVVALLALLPLRLVLASSGQAASGLAARAATGSVWNGRLMEAQWRGAGLGDVGMRLGVVPLLGGVLRWRVAGANLEGAILVGRRTGVAGMTGSAALAGVTPLPVARIEFGGLDAEFAGGVCTAARGEVRMTATGPLALAGAFAGTARCDGGRLLLPLAAGAARIDVSIGGDWDYRAVIVMDEVAEAARAGLLGQGFAPTPTGLVARVEGRL